MNVTVVEWVVTWWRDDGPGTSTRHRSRDYSNEDEARDAYDDIPRRDRMLLGPARMTRRRLERVEKIITSETIEDEDMTQETTT